jgi:hypothetical protein
MKSLSEAEEFWNDRYSNQEFVYGKQPNAFFKAQLDQLEPGILLLPAEGEGRNGVYAARNGWQADAFDMSENGRKKALALADQYNVSINYQISDCQNVQIKSEQYDVIALIYAHIDESMRRKIHRKLIHGLKPGGTLILEAFSKKQLENDSGGPRDQAMLYSLEDLKIDFKALNMTTGMQRDRQISEGNHHQGIANIIRIVAQKPIN